MVWQDSLQLWERGISPNPDVLCNREIKFRALLRAALGLGRDAAAGLTPVIEGVSLDAARVDFLATGHYARLEPQSASGAAPRLLRGVDPTKDQSYFLSHVRAEALQQVLFPLGGMHKAEVRAIAERAGLVTAAKKGSAGICFIGKRHFRRFLAEYIPPRPGDIVDRHGQRLGTHQGLFGFTIGQRAGVGGLLERMFVVDKDGSSNTVVVGRKTDPALWRSRWLVSDVNWIDAAAPAELGRGGVLECECVVRYHDHALPCRVTLLRERAEHAGSDAAAQLRASAVVLVEQCGGEPQFAVTPGQTAAFYRGEECLGGGMIHWPEHAPHALGLVLPAPAAAAATL